LPPRSSLVADPTLEKQHRETPEEAIQAVAESSKGPSPVDSESGDNPLAAFGANEWLVDEMYEQYQRDPNSVDKVWWDFFKHTTPGSGTATSGDAGSGGNGNAPTNGGGAAETRTEKPAEARTEKRPEKRTEKRTEKPAEKST
jgi:multifunctional 2-oxoglutarate metabolism enzyme